MKISIAQLNVHVGNFKKNSEKIIHEIEQAKKQGSELIVFPELAICGYPPRDFLEYDHFVDECVSAIANIAKHCISITAIVGSPSFNTTKVGKRLYNSAFVLSDGRIKEIVHKTLLPTYDIFDEYRYFEPNSVFKCVDVNGKKIALTICEDLWNLDHQKLYKVSPMEELMAHQPTLMINIAASPYDYEQAEERLAVLKWNAKKYKLPLVYVNHVGAQTELIFDGGSLFLSADAELVHLLPGFEEQTLQLDVDKPSTHINLNNTSKIASIHKALVLGIRDYFQKSGFQKAVLGLSGGIDSAVVAALAAKALGPENVLAVLLPSQYSSDHSIKDAEDLVSNFGIQKQVIPIEQIYTSFENGLSDFFHGMNPDLTEENMQARIRGVLLMAISNKFGHILLNTSNKSEVAVGYGTLYGDMCGGLSVIGDVYKTQVYELAKYINSDSELIPENTLVKAPSAELRPGQKDSDSLPEYDLLDQVLYHYIECSKGRTELVEMGFEKSLVDRITGLVNRNEYKRYQTAPILRISPKAFGMGRRMPIVAKY